MEREVSYDNKKEARAFVEILSQNKRALSSQALRNAALLGFAAEDYQHASALIDEGMERRGDQTPLLIARGLIQYKSGNYPLALKSFSQIEIPARGENGNVLVTAALKTNKAAALCLGCEESISNSASATFVQAGTGQGTQGPYQEAIQLLLDGRQLYAKAGYRSEAAENDLNRAEVEMTVGSYETASKSIDAAAATYKELNDEVGLGRIEIARGRLLLTQISHEFLKTHDVERAATAVAQADQHFETGLQLFQKGAFKRGIADAKKDICVYQMLTRPIAELSEAVLYCQEAADMYEAIGYRRGQGDAYGNLGIIFRIQKNYSVAIAKLNQALAIHREIGFTLGVGRQLLNLGRCYSEIPGKKEDARRYFLAARDIFREIGAAYELDVLQMLLTKLDNGTK